MAQQNYRPMHDPWIQIQPILVFGNVEEEGEEERKKLQKSKESS
jgi:hypothetical protein